MIHQFENNDCIDCNILIHNPMASITIRKLDDVLEWFASGMAIDDILGDVPELTEDQIKLALCYAATRLSVHQLNL